GPLMCWRWLQGTLRLVGDKPALILGGRVDSFAQLDERSDRLAAVLEKHGARRGAPVAVVLPNGIEFFETSMAAAKVDAPFLPVNWHLKADEIAYIVGDAGASVVVAEGPVPGVSTVVVGDD